MEDLTPVRCHSLLEDGYVGHLGVIDGDDPYVTPLSYVVVDGRVCFRTGPGRRAAALTANPRVCFEVSRYDDATGDWESVILWGEAAAIEEDRLIQQVIAALLAKYEDALGSPLTHGAPGPGPQASDLHFSIPIESVSGRSSGSFFGVRSRPGRL
jgi:nitroimidazol reductase NimA-like FMN-containing flavoprotein (pyridoxamine 5'-phosphate oxidase superfamily)